MCLIALAVGPLGPWRLVLAANRDEFHDRRAAPASWWQAPDSADEADGADGAAPPELLGGRDLQGGGTWLGLRRVTGGSLRIGALTNLRPGLMPAPAVPAPSGRTVPPSRGRLVAGYLSSHADPAAFLRALDPSPDAYAGFNLLAIELGVDNAGADAWYLNNLPDSQARRLAPGVHVLSNATLDVPWPKTRLLEAAMIAAMDGAAAAAADEPQLAATLLAALRDATEAGDADLPRTGLDLDRERLLSAPFIVDDHYGTRCSTVLLVDRDGQVHFVERSFGPGGRLIGTVSEHFLLGRAIRSA